MYNIFSLQVFNSDKTFKILQYIFWTLRFIYGIQIRQTQKKKKNKRNELNMIPTKQGW